jgi:hypothetical protein
VRKTLATVLLVPALALASCTSVATHHGSAQLDIYASYSGGAPSLPGHTSFNDSPASGLEITTVDRSGHETTARTDAIGLLDMALPPGRYRVLSRCVPDPPVTLLRDLPTHVEIVCAVK